MPAPLPPPDVRIPCPFRPLPTAAGAACWTVFTAGIATRSTGTLAAGGIALIAESAWWARTAARSTNPGYSPPIPVCIAAGCAGVVLVPARVLACSLLCAAWAVGAPAWWGIRTVHAARWARTVARWTPPDTPGQAISQTVRRASLDPAAAVPEVTFAEGLIVTDPEGGRQFHAIRETTP